jgi:ACS family tartrate transporter-like MFS transporter
MTNVALPTARVVDPLERETISRVIWRLMPIVMGGYFVAVLDRANVAMAAPTMNVDLKFTSAIYGFGAGLFFLGYFFAEIPSNLVLNKIGARRWLARIMITWGIIAALTAYVWSAQSFYVIRTLLGLAEAGFFPGVLVYLTWWFPTYYASRMIAVLYCASQLAQAFGAPISGLLLQMHGFAGLHGWQWLFLIEGAPALAMAFVTFYLLTDRPTEAKWLRPEQREWLVNRLTSERAKIEGVRKYSLWEALADWKVVMLSAFYFAQAMAFYSVMFFMPLIMTGLGVTSTWLGLVVGIPPLMGLIAMLCLSYHSDRSGDRYWHVIGGQIVQTAGLALAVFIGPSHPVLLFLALVVGQASNAAVSSVFWAIPSAILTGAAAAGSIAMINSIGQLGGWVGPWVFGLIKDATGADTPALLCFALFPLLSAVFLVLAGVKRQLEHAATTASPGEATP